MGYFVLLSTELTLLLADTRYGVCNVNLHNMFKKKHEILWEKNLSLYVSGKEECRNSSSGC